MYLKCSKHKLQCKHNSTRHSDIVNLILWYVHSKKKIQKHKVIWVRSESFIKNISLSSNLADSFQTHQHYTKGSWKRSFCQHVASVSNLLNSIAFCMCSCWFGCCTWLLINKSITATRQMLHHFINIHKREWHALGSWLHITLSFINVYTCLEWFLVSFMIILKLTFAVNVILNIVLI